MNKITKIFFPAIIIHMRQCHFAQPCTDFFYIILTPHCIVESGLTDKRVKHFKMNFSANPTDIS